MVLSALPTRMSEGQVSSPTRCENLPYIRELGVGGGGGDIRGRGSVWIERLVY